MTNGMSSGVFAPFYLCKQDPHSGRQPSSGDGREGHGLNLCVNLPMILSRFASVKAKIFWLCPSVGINRTRIAHKNPIVAKNLERIS